MRYLLFFSAVLYGCQRILPEEEFITSYSQERCAKIFSCVSEEEQESLTSIYGSQEECAAAIKSELESSLEGQDLVYNGPRATECIDHLMDSSCEEDDTQDDPCSNVYTQPE